MAFDKRLSKEVFLYLEPKTVTREFAQCSTCTMYIAEQKQCMIHAKDKEITPDMTCGYYIEGKPEEHHNMKAEETGLYKGQVRCENCNSFEPPNHCHLFEHLDMDPQVKPDGCCNAFTEVTGIDAMKKKEQQLPDDPEGGLP
jgi:hypothetical protein